jgi:hypothetical protein
MIGRGKKMQKKTIAGVAGVGAALAAAGIALTAPAASGMPLAPLPLVVAPPTTSTTPPPPAEAAELQKVIDKLTNDATKANKQIAKQSLSPGSLAEYENALAFAKAELAGLVPIPANQTGTADHQIVALLTGPNGVAEDGGPAVPHKLAHQLAHGDVTAGDTPIHGTGPILGDVASPTVKHGT